MKKTNQQKETMQKTTYDLEEAIFHTEEDFDLIPHKEKTNQLKENMNYNEKHLLKQLEKDNSPMEFKLFKEDNCPSNFSDQFHKKFNELED